MTEKKINSSITLGISTVYERLGAAMALAAACAPLFEEVLVVVQRSKSCDVKIDGNIRTIFSMDSGLSKSRNLLIQHAGSKWLWINDDDVEILPSHVNFVRNSIEGFGGRYELLAGRIGCVGSDGCYKRYRFRALTPLLFAQVSSVEMILNRHWCIERGIEFDDAFGLGTSRPVAEEPIFAADLVKAGGRIKDLGAVIVNHPCGDIGVAYSNSWSRSSISFVRGQAASRIGGGKGLVWLAFAFLSAMVHGKSFHSVRQILSGYFSKERA